MKIHILMLILSLSLLQIPAIFLPGISIGKSNKYYITAIVIYEIIVVAVSFGTFYYFAFLRT